MKTTEPRYLIAKHYILNGIKQKLWKTGEQVPSENELVKACHISRMTARKALEELCAEGIIVRTQGKGSFVAEEKQQTSILQIKNIKTEVLEQGQEYSSQLLEMSKIKPTDTLQNLFKLDDTQLIYHSMMLHFANKAPIQVEERFINAKLVPDYIHQDFKVNTPNEYLTKIAPITEAEHIIEAIAPEKRLQNLLHLDDDEAILQLIRTTWSFEQAISYAKFYYPGKRYQFKTRFNPKNLGAVAHL